MKTKWTEIIIVVAVLLFISYAFECFAAWDNDNPTDAQTWNTAALKIRDNWDALEVELGVDLNEAHPYYQSSAPTKKPDTTTALDVDDNGRLWIDSDDNVLYLLTDYAGPTWTVAGAIANITSADATFTLQNTDEEDSDGGRQSQYIVKGEQSGSEATTLGYIEFNHDGTSDDQKGQFLIKLNDGDDDDAPSKQPIGYLSTGKIDVSASLSVLDEDDLASDDDEVVPTQQSVKAYVAFSAYTNLDSENNAMLKAHAYLAATDGFVAAYSLSDTGGHHLKGFVGATNDPAGAGTKIQDNESHSSSDVRCIFLAVAAGEYFEVTEDSSTNPTILWKSRGTLSKPVDQN